MTDEIDAEAAFAALAERFAREPDVEFGTGFGSALRAVDGAYIGSGLAVYESLLTSPRCASTCR